MDKLLENIKNSSWWKAAGVRAVRTFAQSAVAGIGTAAVLSEVNFKYVLSASLLAALLSLLTSLSGLPEVTTTEESDETTEEET